MGVCASCLGLDRHPSHDRRTDTDRLLDDSPIAQYGAIETDDLDAQPDEEEVRREREVLEQITARAADNMIDVLHADHIEGEHHLTPNLSYLSLKGLRTQQPTIKDQDEHTDEEIEQAWLKDIHASDTDNDVTVKGSYTGNLVIDLGRLRQTDQSNVRREV
ncbi:hypothetical protein AMS68_007442 [Peltaster fructicola]|uniref:Uncharacterized protein n=1 Tax=Peltaster fructicola TaxID=286661 RepID=A0A6H0Y4S7_9PEZI|nr:hypothetical protein AMS68_007442 [Peltaster fructicola]